MDPTRYNNTGKHPMMTVDDIDQMPDTPYRGSHHRRAHSDTTFRFDDLLLFDPSDLDLSSLDLPTPTKPPRVAPMAVDNSSDDSTSKSHHPHPPKPNHLRSLSVDSDFFDSFDPVDDKFGGNVTPAAVGEKRVHHHRQSNSMDGFEAESNLFDGTKKAMDADRLAELALIDPKRAKRILANRQSAARSKERKVRYTGELERKVQTLQTEATTLSAQVTMLQRDTTGLTVENKELKLRLQALEQQAHLRDALNEALREEVQRLRIAAGQVPAMNGSLYSQHAPQFTSHQAALPQFGNSQQTHQFQQQQQQQHQVPQASTNNQAHPGHAHSTFPNYGQKV